jgi:hypothetical protein
MAMIERLIVTVVELERGQVLQLTQEGLRGV